MELVDLMKHISEDTIPHLLILFGEEQCIIDLYINQIAQVTGCTRIPSASVSYVINKSGKKSLDKSSKLYIVSNDTDFQKSEDAWKKTADIFSKRKDYLIIRYDKLDKRDSFYKNNKQNSVQFSHLTTEVLQTYVERDLPGLSLENANKLIGICGNDYGRIMLELDKIEQYMQATNEQDADTSYKLLDSQDAFYKEIGDITFELTNAVLGGYPDESLRKLDEAKRKGEPAMMIASILYNGFRNLLAYQGLGSNKKGAMERTGMSKGELYGCSKNVGGYSFEEVKRNMLLCQKVESGIKMGTIDEDIALDYLVLTCLK